VGFWAKFLAWESAPERPWNAQEKPKEEIPPVVPPGAEGGPSEKAEATAGAGDEDPWPEGTTETFEQRVDRLWNIVTDKQPPLKDMKEACGVTNRKTITPENIAAFEKFVVGYEKK